MLWVKGPVTIVARQDTFKLTAMLGRQECLKSKGWTKPLTKET